MKLLTYLEDHKATDLACAIGVHPVLISQWAGGVRRVPSDRCISIEKATDGVVRCEDLRPDIDWTYLRGTAETKGQEAA